MDSNSVPVSDMSGSPLTNGRFSNRAARFYWADEEPSQQAYSIQQISKISSTDSHFEESPLVIASISAGVIGVAITIIILVGIWIRSRLFSEEGRSGGVENQNNASVRSSMSTLEEESYVVCMEMDATVLGSMHNVADNYCANNSTILEMEDDNRLNDSLETDSSVPAAKIIDTHPTSSTGDKDLDTETSLKENSGCQ